MKIGSIQFAYDNLALLLFLQIDKISVLKDFKKLMCILLIGLTLVSGIV